MHEHRFAPFVRMDEAVTTVPVKPTLDDTHSSSPFVNHPLAPFFGASKESPIRIPSSDVKRMCIRLEISNNPKGRSPSSIGPGPGDSPVRAQPRTGLAGSSHIFTSASGPQLSGSVDVA